MDYGQLFEEQVNKDLQDAADFDAIYETARDRAKEVMAPRTGVALVEESLGVIRDRRAKYGNESLEFFTSVADMWSSWAGVHLVAEDVSVMMILFKIIRHDLARQPADDDLEDIIGYTAVWKDIEVQRNSQG